MITPSSGCRSDTGLGIIVELLAIFLSIASPFGLKIAVDAFREVIHFRIYGLLSLVLLFLSPSGPARLY